MNADAFRQFYEYHFSENRRMWDHYVMSLTYEQFRRDVPYSLGSVHSQVVHIMNTDDAWFNELRGVERSDPYVPASFDDRAVIRECWDNTIQHMRNYLERLQDFMLMEKPIAAGEDRDLFLWQVLLHVVNHGTDHRAQVLRALHDMGLKTASQDYIVFAREHR